MIQFQWRNIIVEQTTEAHHEDIVDGDGGGALDMETDCVEGVLVESWSARVNGVIHDSMVLKARVGYPRVSPEQLEMRTIWLGCGKGNGKGER